jgi:hypothetical protein
MAGTRGDVGEARWPMASAVLAAIVLTILLPDAIRIGPRWFLPVLEGVLLVIVVVADPGRINRRSREIRIASIVLVSVLVLATLWSTGLLIDDLIRGGPETNSATELLAAGTAIWFSNIIAFALLYWELDSGGAAARAHRIPEHGDFAFPQQSNPRVAEPNWRPLFVDYLYLAYTNATAFSPTDAMPLVPWAKLTMVVQSFISIAILGLVIARAVNVFT